MRVIEKEKTKVEGMQIDTIVEECLDNEKRKNHRVVTREIDREVMTRKVAKKSEMKNRLEMMQNSYESVKDYL